MKKNIISLFDGMSCGQVAISKLCESYQYFASEVEKNPIQVTQKNFPETIQIGDIRNINYIDGVLTNGINFFEIGEVFLLQGGSPCQNLSFAGSMEGLKTNENIEVTNLDQYLDLKNKGFKFKGQSYLFWEYVRILREVNPKYFLLENVIMQKKWEDIFSKELKYNAVKIDSKLISAQTRKRLYWTNFDFEIPEDRFVSIQDISSPQKEDEIIPFDFDERIKIRFENNTVHVDVPEATKKGFITAKEGQFVDLSFIKSNTRRGRLMLEKSNCVTATKSIFCQVTNKGFRLLNINEIEKLQTLTENYSKGVSNSSRQKMIGNGWTCDLIEHIYKNIF